MANFTRGQRMLTNPVVRRVAKCTDYSADCVTYKGISRKIYFYLAMVVVGIVLSIQFQTVGHKVGVEDAVLNDGYTMYLSILTNVEITGFFVSLILFIVAPILASFIRVLTPAAGTLYCVASGYVVTFLATVFEEYKAPVLYALVLTVVLFFALAFLYRSGIIQVTQKFRTAFFGIVIAMILGSIVMFIFSFIPGLKYIPHAVYGNSALGILFSILGLVIASIFVIMDFDMIEHAVEGGLDKKYEWMCAFALVFSLIYLYFKILEIVLKVMSRRD